MEFFRSFWSYVSGSAPLEGGVGATVEMDELEAEACESLRAGMLRLATRVTGIEGLRLRHQITMSDDLQSLWFLRSNLAFALAQPLGEHDAMRQIEAISAPVRARLPRSLSAVPSQARRSACH